MAAKLATEGFELLGNTPEEARENHLHELDVIPRLMKDIGIIAQ